jgi:hypothetical protein
VRERIATSENFPENYSRVAYAVAHRLWKQPYGNARDAGKIESGGATAEGRRVQRLMKGTKMSILEFNWALKGLGLQRIWQNLAQRTCATRYQAPLMVKRL